MVRNFYINCMELEVKIIKSLNKNTKLLLINKTKKIFFELNDAVRWDQDSRHLIIDNVILNPLGAISNSILEKFIFSINRLWYSKITFKGKGFKIKKRKRTKSIKFYFYFSHLKTILLKKAMFKQKKKNKIIIKTWNFNNKKKTEQNITNIRPLNIFTKRGLRCSRQMVSKKTGKKSNY